jgi:hypothetical protein
MAVADRHGLPVAICVESATPHEVKLATHTLVQMVIPDAPQNLVGDNAYDSDKLDSELRRYGIELIAPHRMNRKNTTQDLRRLRRYRGDPSNGTETYAKPYNGYVNRAAPVLLGIVEASVGAAPVQQVRPA